MTFDVAAFHSLFGCASGNIYKFNLCVNYLILLYLYIGFKADNPLYRHNGSHFLTITTANDLMSFRPTLVTAILTGLLLWGPIDHNSKYGLLIRLGYLVLIPVLMHFLLRIIWKWLEPTERLERLLGRMLAIILSVCVFIGAIAEAISKYHIGNSQWVRSAGGGMEDVGDDIVLPGPDWFAVTLLLVISVVIFWIGVIKARPETSKDK